MSENGWFGPSQDGGEREWATLIDVILALAYHSGAIIQVDVPGK